MTSMHDMSRLVGVSVFRLQQKNNRADRQASMTGRCLGFPIPVDGEVNESQLGCSLLGARRRRPRVGLLIQTRSPAAARNNVPPRFRNTPEH